MRHRQRASVVPFPPDVLAGAGLDAHQIVRLVGVGMGGLRPTKVPSPGHIIRRELDARGWNQKELAYIMDCSEQTISQIVNGKKRITQETALQLATAFGASADLWLNMETSYQLHQEE